MGRTFDRSRKCIAPTSREGTRWTSESSGTCLAQIGGRGSFHNAGPIWCAHIAPFWSIRGNSVVRPYFIDIDEVRTDNGIPTDAPKRRNMGTPYGAGIMERTPSADLSQASPAGF